MQVTMHKATDGALFETFEAFAKHEEKLKIEAAIKADVLNTNDFHETDAGYLALDLENVASFVAANADVLRKALEVAKVVKRGRGPGKKKVEAPAQAAA